MNSVILTRKPPTRHHKRRAQFCAKMNSRSCGGPSSVSQRMAEKGFAKDSKTSVSGGAAMVKVKAGSATVTVLISRFVLLWSQEQSSSDPPFFVLLLSRGQLFASLLPIMQQSCGTGTEAVFRRQHQQLGLPMMSASVSARSRLMLTALVKSMLLKYDSASLSASRHYHFPPSIFLAPFCHCH